MDTPLQWSSFEQRINKQKKCPEKILNLIAKRKQEGLLEIQKLSKKWKD